MELGCAVGVSFTFAIFVDENQGKPCVAKFSQNVFCSLFVGLSVPAASNVTEDPDEDFDEDDDSAEADDDGRVYKNPRNHPSPDCPRDEEQATLLG